MDNNIYEEETAPVTSFLFERLGIDPDDGSITFSWFVKSMTLLVAQQCAHMLSEDRDRFIMSKGHGAMAQYAVMHHLGILTDEDMATFFRTQSGPNKSMFHRLRWFPFLVYNSFPFLLLPSSFYNFYSPQQCLNS